MKVELIASTALRAAAYDHLPVIPEAGTSTDSEYLIEFAGRACYQSWDRPGELTRKTRDYVRRNIIGKEHGSVLEHASATFYITGVSRSLTHELIRHRAGTAYSELSQRYVDMAEVQFVVPPAYREAGILPDEWQTYPPFEEAREGYKTAMEMIPDGVSRKRAREAARSVIPSAAETKIVMTANYRAWRHIIRMRGSEHADAEIRELALEILRQLYEEAPSVFDDFSVVTLEDGRQVVV